MSRLSFKTFCIELYADHKSIPGNEAYTLFEKNGILKMLDESHTGKCYADDSTGLYGQSANYVFSLLCDEMAD